MLSTLLKSSLLILSLVTIAALADDQFDRETTIKAPGAFVLKVNNDTKETEVIKLDSLKAPKNFDSMSDADKVALIDSVNKNGVKMATTNVSELDKESSTESCGHWYWGPRFHWNNCYRPYNPWYCGGYPMYYGYRYNYWGNYPYYNYSYYWYRY